MLWWYVTDESGYGWVIAYVAEMLRQSAEITHIFFSIPKWAQRYFKTELAAQSIVFALQWRHNELEGVSDLDHQPHDCLLNRVSRRRSKKTSELRVTGPFFRRIRRRPVNSPHNGPVTRKMFPESARWRLKSSWPTATSLCIILNIRVRRWSCLRLVSSSKPSSESMAVTLDRDE